MLSSNLPEESELLKSILEPLLEDFEYWFERSRHLLETEEMSFLTQPQQSDLLNRIIQAQQKVIATKTMFYATGDKLE